MRAAFFRFGVLFLALLGCFSLPRPAYAAPAVAASREAAFTDPGVNVAGGASGSEAIVVEPKGDIDTGETFVGVARRVTLFFINQSSAPVGVVSVASTNDGNVKSDIVSDDCSAGSKSINSGSRCAVAVEITPASPGPWTAEVLLTHNGSGRIARVKLSGKTSNKGSSDKKETGLSLSTKDNKPVDFSEVVANQAKVARTALMVNDSNETISLMSIDVIAADNGLERLDQGCTVDMELKPGESCPVTLVWRPTAKGVISTDLIIRHTGRLGFAVIPVRGTAKTDALEKDEATADASGKKKGKDDGKKSEADKVPMPTSAQELEKLVAGGLPKVDGAALNVEDSGLSKAAAPQGPLRLIGTVGNRALILKPDGATVVAGIGEEVPLSNGRTMKIMNVSPRTAEIFIDGKRKTLSLEAAQELISKASSADKAKEAGGAGAGPGRKDGRK
jgi:hypothetical protein